MPWVAIPIPWDLDYRLNTPWKAGVSLGHTVGNCLALGATYEYAWYNHMDNRVKDGGYYDSWYGDYYETSSSDAAMNDHTKHSLQGVSTLKLGLEYKPIPLMSLRLGYNYVSPMFKETADRDQTIASQGTIVFHIYRLYQLEGYEQGYSRCRFQLSGPLLRCGIPV